MTLAEIEASNKVMLLPKDVAPVLGCHEHTIRLSARDGDLPFPFFKSGNRVKIPRIPFLRWINGGLKNGEKEALAK